MAKDSYKAKHLGIMLAHEEAPDGGYGAHLTHWYGDSNPLSIDADGLRVLYRYYSGNDGDTEQEKEKGLFNRILDMLPRKPETDTVAWTEGSMILTDEKTANSIADALEAFGMEGISTGCYDPEEDARNGETDMCTGWYYVSQD